MSEAAGRYGTVAAAFTRRVEAVPAGAWDNPAPCEGWVARDVVRHLVEWLPAFFFERWGVESAGIPSVDDDPVGAWAVVDGAFRRAFDDPAVATAPRDTPMGPLTFEVAVDMLCTSDLLVHTWDIARATGGDERLDPDQVRALLQGMEPMDAALRASGHFGPRVAVPPDADDQTRLIAFTGRTP